MLNNVEFFGEWKKFPIIQTDLIVVQIRASHAYCHNMEHSGHSNFTHHAKPLYACFGAAPLDGARIGSAAADPGHPDPVRQLQLAASCAVWYREMSVNPTH